MRKFLATLLVSLLLPMTTPAFAQERDGTKSDEPTGWIVFVRMSFSRTTSTEDIFLVPANDGKGERNLTANHPSLKNLRPAAGDGVGFGAMGAPVVEWGQLAGDIMTGKTPAKNTGDGNGQAPPANGSLSPVMMFTLTAKKGHHALFIADKEGKNIREVTKPHDGIFLTTVDGSLAYTTIVSDKGSNDLNLCLQDAGWRKKEIAKGVEHATLSRDAKRAVIVKYVGNGKTRKQQMSILDMADNGKSRVIREAAEWFQLGPFSHDGRYCWFLQSAPVKDPMWDYFVYDLNVLDTETGTITLLVEKERIRTMTQASWSPDGRSIVYSITKDDRVTNSFKERRHICVVDVASKKVTQLTSGSVHDIDPSWSPDGKWIVFARANHWHGGELHIIGSNGQGMRRLTSPSQGFGDSCPKWRPADDR